MTALAWPLVALVAIGTGAWLFNRWLNRSVDVEAAQHVLTSSFEKARWEAEQAKILATALIETHSPERVQALESRVDTLEMAAGLRAVS